MARPRKDSEEKGAEARMIEAFWDQLSRMPYREVTAASVARQAGCNRATFYYYFDSIEDLAEQAVDAAIPTGIADLAEKFLSESGTQFRLDENQRGAVERICLLTGPNGSTRLTERFKRALAETWASKFGLDLTQEDVHAVAPSWLRASSASSENRKASHAMSASMLGSKPSAKCSRLPP